MDDIQNILILIVSVLWLISVVMVFLDDEFIGIVKLIIIFIPILTLIYFLWHTKDFIILLLKPIYWIIYPFAFILSFLIKKPLEFMFGWLWR